VSSSKDSTIKLFDVDQTSKTFGKLVQDLSGHSGTQFTCFTGTKVQLLTQQEAQTKCLQSTGALTVHVLLPGARTAHSSCGGTKKRKVVQNEPNAPDNDDDASPNLLFAILFLFVMAVGNKWCDAVVNRHIALISLRLYRAN